MAKDNKKKNLKQQKLKQKQKQQQTVIVNILTSKKRRSTKKGKSSSGGSSITSTPIIQTLPIQYTPYTMYDTSSLLTEANRRSLVPNEAPRPLTAAEPIGMQLADPTKATDTFTQDQLGAFLEDPNKQAPKVNDILDNVVVKQEGADANEKNNRKTGTSSTNCPCGGKYKDTTNDYVRHMNTAQHQKYEKRIGILTSSKQKG